MQITVHGAAHEVTGSCHLLSAGGRQVLLDCGLFQGAPVDERRNLAAFPFSPREIDAVVLSHAHIDHSGRLPFLVKAGFSGRIYAHPATRDLCRIMLKDSAYLYEKGVEVDNRKRARKGLAPLAPLFTAADAEMAVRRIRPLAYGQRVEVAPGITVRLSDAGHILGSSIVEAWLEDSGVSRKVVFSGDLGHHDMPINRDPTPIAEADLVLMESTYGNRRHRPWSETVAEIGGILEGAHASRGNILIPAFAVGRTQELLAVFRQHFDDWNLARWRIFLDSPMAIAATRVYDRHATEFDKEARIAARRPGGAFDLPNLHLTRTPQQSMGINAIRSGAIVIAGSGMCTGGRIRHHLKQNIWRRECDVIFVGFQARGTLGRQLVDGARRIRLWGETMQVAARIHTVGGLSAHADAADLAGWYGAFKDRPRVALVHGEAEGMEALAGTLETKFGARVLMPTAGQTIAL